MPDCFQRHETALQWIIAGAAISFVATLLIVTRRPVIKTVNWLRRRAKLEPLVLES